jgi:hypothetical protein
MTAEDMIRAGDGLVEEQDLKRQRVGDVSPSSYTHGSIGSEGDAAIAPIEAPPPMEFNAEEDGSGETYAQDGGYGVAEVDNSAWAADGEAEGYDQFAGGEVGGNEQAYGDEDEEEEEQEEDEDEEDEDEDEEDDEDEGEDEDGGEGEPEVRQARTRTHTHHMRPATLSGRTHARHAHTLAAAVVRSRRGRRSFRTGSHSHPYAVRILTVRIWCCPLVTPGEAGFCELV